MEFFTTAGVIVVLLVIGTSPLVAIGVPVVCLGLYMWISH